MGKKKKKKDTYVTLTTKTNLVKMSYLQTLALADNLGDITDIETSAKNSGLKTVASSSSSGGEIKKFYFGSKKSKTQVAEKTTGQKIVDQWLQPEFDRIRYAIGIREFTAAAYKFAEQSEFISVPFVSPKEIIKAHIVVDEYIPPQFDNNQIWMKYYIRIEGENEWIRINPLNSPTRFNQAGQIVPKIVNFNLPKPTTAQIEDKYQYTEDEVKQIRFRAVFTRPIGGDNDSMTPMLKSYRIVLVPRS